MQPFLWGPGLWQAVFACAWVCRTQHVPALRDLLLRLLPVLLPCERCRFHFIEKKAKVKRRAGGEPRDSRTAFRWLYYVKDEVNRTKACRSPPIADVETKYALHGPVVDDVLLGDALVLVALDAQERAVATLCAEFCATLAMLLPLPNDSELRTRLSKVNMARPIVPQVVAAAHAARVERGLPTLSLKEYLDIVD